MTKKKDLECDTVEESLLDGMQDEEGGQVMVVTNVLVGIETFTFPIDFVILNIEEDLQASHVLIKPLLSSNQIWNNVNEGGLTDSPCLWVRSKQHLISTKRLLLTEHERIICMNISSLLLLQ